MRPWDLELAGRIEAREIDSPALAGNPLGDPTRRPLWVYLPPGYDDEPDRRYPTIYVLQGFGGYVTRWALRPGPFSPATPEALDAVFAGGAPPCIVVYVDAFTALGGSQFVDSPATGNYATYLCEDVVGFVDAAYRTLASPRHRALQGKSSGGFGAMVNAMTRPDVFGAFASHAGDAGYEHCYLPEIRDAYRALRDHYDRSYDAFFADLAARPLERRPYDHVLVSCYAVAACFSPAPDGGVELPFDPATGRLRAEVWERWLAWDPVRMVRGHAEALRGARAIWIDAGRADDYGLDLGAEALVDELRLIGVEDVAFELFEGTHSGIDHRYPLAAAYLAEAMRPEA
ncbi:MAG TPA: alpha/beta hydrolase-fold protein [Acidimicrobiales bacterium]|nr:alpha/beta hydrolase-fold protein [Acidimicrobiales bacterium]